MLPPEAAILAEAVKIPENVSCAVDEGSPEAAVPAAAGLETDARRLRAASLVHARAHAHVAEIAYEAIRNSLLRAYAGSELGDPFQRRSG